MSTAEFDLYEEHLLPVIPRVDTGNSGDIDFEMINCFPSKFVCFLRLLTFIILLVGDCVVVDDVETGKATVEINGDASYLQFPIHTSFQYLAFQIKNLDRFMKITLQIRDHENQIRAFTLTNKRTTIQVKDNSCHLPIELGLGWQYFNLDLDDLMRRSFGTNYSHILEIIVFGSTRIGKIYLQDREYSDAELPTFLRLIAPDN
jgi:hypothetical protein